MSSVKQEVAAILMDYTDRMPEDVYMNILRQLGEIPDHKDPKTAVEIQNELDKVLKDHRLLDEENDILREENDELSSCVGMMANKVEKIMACEPSFEDDNIIMFENNSESKSFRKRVFEGKLLLELFDEWRVRLVDDDDDYDDEDDDYDEDVSNAEVCEVCGPGECGCAVLARCDVRVCQGCGTFTRLSDIAMLYDNHPTGPNIYGCCQECYTYSRSRAQRSAPGEEAFDISWKTFSNQSYGACGFDPDVIIDEIKTTYGGKVNNYYGAILLHEKNCWTNQVETADSFNKKTRRSQKNRDRQYMNFKNTEIYWKNVTSSHTAKSVANTSMC